MKLIDTIHAFDVSLFSRLLNAKSYPMQSSMARYISKTADGELYLLLMLGLYLGYGFENNLLFTLILAFFIERPSYFVLKNMLKRNRPSSVLKNYQSLITPSDQFSFPSGHTSAAFLAATLISCFYPIFALPLIIWACLVGFSRVALGVHFPTDLVAGSVLGMGSAWLSMELLGL